MGTEGRFFRGIGAIAAGLIGVLAVATDARADASTTSIEQGYEQGRILSPRSLALGGAQAALGSSTTALYENPANLTLARVYHFEGVATLSPEARRQSVGGAIVDSSTSKLAGGIAGTWNMLDPDGIHRQWSDLRLGLAYPFGDRFSMGLIARYLRADQKLYGGPLGTSQVSGGLPNGPITSSLTFDLGAAFVLAEGLRLGAAGHNLTNPGNGIEPTWVSGGLGFNRDIFSLEGDVGADFTTFKSTRARYMFGGEVFIANRVPIRLGYRYDDGMKTHALSGGLGWVDRGWSIELSGAHDVVGEHPATFVTLALRFFYNATSGGDLDTSNEAF